MRQQLLLDRASCRGLFCVQALRGRAQILGRLLALAEAGPHPFRLLGAHLLQRLPAGLVGFTLKPLVLGFPAFAELRGGGITTLLRFLHGARVLLLRTAAPGLGRRPGSCFRVLLGLRELHVPALTRGAGLLLDARLRVGQPTRTL